MERPQSAVLGESAVDRLEHSIGRGTDDVRGRGINYDTGFLPG
ncbi:hypothetical protein [Streptomyces sp. A30]